MSTQFYLADAHYMIKDEIERAEAFDENAFVCHVSNVREGMTYSLGIHPLYLLNIPKDSRLVNDNGSKIQTIGDLLEAINKEGAILKTPFEVLNEDNEFLREYLLSLPDIGPWAIFKDEKRAVAEGVSPDSLFVLPPNAEHYLKRKGFQKSAEL